MFSPAPAGASPERQQRYSRLGNRLGDAAPPLCTARVRRGEALAIRRDDIDFETARLTINGSAQRVKEDSGGSTTIQILQPKTPGARRTIKIPEVALARLRTWRVEQTERRLRIGGAWIEAGVVADRGDGGLLCPDAFTTATKRLVKAAGLDAATRLHDLRHAYATALLAGGVHPAIASAVLGHATPAFTLTQYSHVLDAMTDVAAEAIDAAFASPV